MTTAYRFPMVDTFLLPECPEQDCYETCAHAHNPHPSAAVLAPRREAARGQKPPQQSFTFGLRWLLGNLLP